LEGYISLDDVRNSISFYLLLKRKEDTLNTYSSRASHSEFNDIAFLLVLFVIALHVYGYC
jgi:hypothetical protein